MINKLDKKLKDKLKEVLDCLHEKEIGFNLILVDAKNIKNLTMQHLSNISTEVQASVYSDHLSEYIKDSMKKNSP